MKKIRAKRVNLSVFLILISALAVYGRLAEEEVSTPAPYESHLKRYFAGNRFNGVILEIKGQKYTERYRSIRDRADRLVSQGTCVKRLGALTLTDAGTGVRREFRFGEDELTYISRGKQEFCRYLETELDWSAILLSEESPYLVDGVRLGDSLAEVEARWGELKPDKESANVFRAVNLDGRQVELDSYDRVESIGGESLTAHGETILSTKDNFEVAKRIGVRPDFKPGCGGGNYPIRVAQRVLGDNRLEVIAFKEAVIKQQYPDQYRKMKSTGVDFDRVTSLKLSFWYLQPEDLKAADK